MRLKYGRVHFGGRITEERNCMEYAQRAAYFVLGGYVAGNEASVCIGRGRGGAERSLLMCGPLLENMNRVRW